MSANDRLKEITTTLISLMVFIMAGLLLWLSIGVKNWFIQNNAFGKMAENSSEVKTDGQTVPLDDWNVYESKEFGFVLKYPALWIVEDRGFVSDVVSESGKSYTLFFSPTSEELATSSDIVPSSDPYIGLIIYPSRASLEDFLCSSQEEKKTCFSRKVFAFGVPVLVKTFEHSGDAVKKREVFFMKDGNLFHWYTLSRGIPQNESLSVLNEKIFIIDQVVNSMRFLK